MFGGAVGVGVFSVSVLEPFVQKLMPTHTPIGHLTKGLESRIVEVALSSGACFALNKYVIRNDYSPNDWMKRMGVIAVADLAAETVMKLFMIV